MWGLVVRLHGEAKRKRVKEGVGEEEEGERDKKQRNGRKEGRREGRKKGRGGARTLWFGKLHTWGCISAMLFLTPASLYSPTFRCHQADLKRTAFLPNFLGTAVSLLAFESYPSFMTWNSTPVLRCLEDRATELRGEPESREDQETSQAYSGSHLLPRYQILSKLSI